MESDRLLSINPIDEGRVAEEGWPPVPLCHKGNEDVQEQVDPQALLIAATFLSDAVNGRLEEHRNDPASLKLYRAYKRGRFQLAWKIFIYIDLLLALIEPPYTITPPFAGLSALIEVACMLALLVELVVRYQFLERRAFFRSSKIITQAFVITATLADVMLSSATGNSLRLTRYLRPWLLFYSSRLLRTAANTIRRILFSLFDLLLLIMLAIILFGSVCAVIFLGSREGELYFPDLFTAYINLFFGLYSLNYPDIAAPAYHESPWWVLLFVGYVLVVAWFLMSIVLATIYTVYKSGLKGEVAQVLYHQHQRLAAAWQLCGCQMSGHLSWSVWQQLFAVFKPRFKPEKVALLFRVLDKGQKGHLRYKEFLRVVDLLTYRVKRIHVGPHIFCRICPSLYHSRASEYFRKIVLHKFASWAVDAVIVGSVVVLLVELQLKLTGDNVTSEIRFENHASEYVLFSVLWFEFFCRIYALGPSAYWRYHWHKFDVLLLAFVSTGFGVLLAEYATPIDWVKVIFIGRLLRLTRLFSRVRRFQSTLRAIYDVIPALRPIFLTQLVLYYVFALIGMQAWAGEITESNPALKGTMFAELHYYFLNFNSFVEALFTLFHINVINNYNVTAMGYAAVSGRPAWLFFVIFNLLAVIIMFNVMVAFIIEAFQKREQKANTADAMRKRINKVVARSEEEDGLHAWSVRESRDPFHILRRLLLDEILAEDETTAWLNYLGEHDLHDKTKAKKKRRGLDDSDSESDDEVVVDEPVLKGPRGTRGGSIYISPHHEPVVAGNAFASWDGGPGVSATAGQEEDDEVGLALGRALPQKRRLGVSEVGSKIRRAWARRWRSAKGTGNRFYIPSITRDRYNNLRIVWEDEEGELG